MKMKLSGLAGYVLQLVLSLQFGQSVENSLLSPQLVERSRVSGMRVWYLKADGEFERKEPGMLYDDPPQFVSIAQLHTETGIVHMKVDVESEAALDMVEQIVRTLNISTENELEINSTTPQQQFDRLYEEHYHPYDEPRLVLNGVGYFDVRDPDNRWIRIEARRGDFIIVPEGLFHRFTVTSQVIKYHRPDDSNIASSNDADIFDLALGKVSGIHLDRLSKSSRNECTDMDNDARFLQQLQDMNVDLAN